MSLPETIQQWETSQDGIENLKQTTAPLPWPGKNEVLVMISALAINYRDTEVIMGLYKHHKTTGEPTASMVPCSDMCGTVTASNSPNWKVGDRVLSIFNQNHVKGQIVPENMKSGLGSPLPGCLTQYRVFPDYGLVKAPDYLSDEQACTLAIAGVTAWMAVNGMRPLGQAGGKGEKVLVQGTGGVAISGLQIAAASGAEVIVTSSSDAKLEQANKLGAAHTINYRTNKDWEEEVLKVTNGEGADIIFENGGAQTLRKSFECVKFGGLINCIGYLSGKVDAADDRTNTNLLALKRNVTLKGILNGPKDRFEEMLKFYDEKKIEPVVDRVFAFDEAKEALNYLFAGGHFGKVVIKIS
ncbi:hypothetical protein BJ878DRAFT_304344 [Calycina marina]|uniref:Enoyl reductase (ER) domain-containing protein n=1 Tax=Calycina marina TaxID=1763456 RepID=A0A9P7YUY3_9HELO|nr:hypothetical protein BJ878DRAFT_304344 [Calycina marina]